MLVFAVTLQVSLINTKFFSFSACQNWQILEDEGLAYSLQNEESRCNLLHTIFTSSMHND